MGQVNTQTLPTVQASEREKEDIKEKKKKNNNAAEGWGLIEKE